MRFFTLIETPVGRLAAMEEDGALAYLGCPESMPAGGEARETELFIKLRQELREYFEGRRRAFDIPLVYGGTPFQAACWRELLRIPYGQTRSYGELAVAAGNPKAARAAGGACNANRILILIPCHRVVGATGALTGFGAGLPAKELLLALEKGAAPGEDANLAT